MAADITRAMRDGAYAASADLAAEKGALPAVRCRQGPGRAPLREPPAGGHQGQGAQARYCATRTCCRSRRPARSRSRSRRNASGGIEPTFSWTYMRKKRMPDGSKQEYTVEDYAYRLFRHMGGDDRQAAADFRARARHERDGPHEDDRGGPAVHRRRGQQDGQRARGLPVRGVRDLYLEAWNAGLKGITTYRPNNVIGSVLEVKEGRRPHASRRRT